MAQIVPGQRWISSAEPELGLGRIAKILERDIIVEFDQISEIRQYRIENSPLARFKLSVGDRARSVDGLYLITAVEEREGLLFYLHAEGEFSEADLCNAIASEGVELTKRVLAGNSDSVETFELRVAANQLQQEIESSPARGLVGARIELLPHQLYIAERACSEGRLPRRLLSDEVGLGKTIEAGLIYHRLKKTKRIKRTLIITPEALRFQWFTEMLQRFHSCFTIIDDDYCASLDVEAEEDNDLKKLVKEKIKEQPNPFLSQDEMLVGMDWIFATHEQELQEGMRSQIALEKQITKRIGWLLEARFDLVIIDEAHTIDPDQRIYSQNYGALNLQQVLRGQTTHHPDLDNHLNPEFIESSAEFKLLNQIARRTPGLLLLTATPVQLYPKAHFARLHLLDPVRYPDYREWDQGRSQYEELAQQLNELFDQIEAPQEPWKSFCEKLPSQSPLQRVASSIPDIDQLSVRDVIQVLCDTAGTGRVMIRNTRKSVGGFPERKLHSYPLAEDPHYRKDLLSVIDMEYDGETESFQLNQTLSVDLTLFMEEEQPALINLWKRDEKALWLAQLLQGKLKDEKVLVLCTTRPTALALQKTVEGLTGIECELFHEQMEMVDRDRAAARFAEPDGVPVLIASEIGSEGRNFQFSHNIVMFDLPSTPGLLEQRIGRLDRIGQKKVVEIHVPYVENSMQHRLFEWYHHALGAFVEPLMGIEQIHDQFKEKLQLYLDQPEFQLEKFRSTFAKEVRNATSQLRKEMENGRDRLLEFNSYSVDEAAHLVELIREEDEENRAEQLVLETLEHFGFEVKHGQIPNSWVISGESYAPQVEFPGLSDEGMTATTDRDTALLNNSIDFFTIDHPLVQGAFDLLLGSEKGRCSFAFTQGKIPRGLYFEFHFNMNNNVPSGWNLQEALHSISFSILLDSTGKSRPDLLEKIPFLLLEEGSTAQLESIQDDLLSKMENLEKRASQLIAKEAQQHLVSMHKEACRLIDGEVRRLRMLEKGGYPGISKRIQQMELRKEGLFEALRLPDLRLDALRLLWSH